MKQQLNLTFIDNESHGYIKLSKYDLQGFGIGIKEFSKYSYYNPDNACYYFEEDLGWEEGILLELEHDGVGWTIQQSKVAAAKVIGGKPDVEET